MSVQWPSPTYVDGDFTTAQPCSLPVLSSPIPRVATEYILRQDFMQFRKDFAPLPLDTAHPSAGMTPDYSDFKLASEGERSDAGNGIVKWTRIYAKTPATHNEYESFAYNFIGFWGRSSSVVGVFAGDGSIIGRERFTQVVKSRIQHDYFRCASGETYTNPADIPIVPAQVYFQGDESARVYVNFIWDSPDVFTVTTTPSRSDYQSIVNGGGEIVAEDSRPIQWQGNIWLRTTRYIFAK